MENNVSIITLLISGVVALAMGVLFFVAAGAYPKNIKGLNEWAWSPVLFALSVPLMIGTGVLPDILSIVVSNLLLFFAAILLSIGTKKFAGIDALTSLNLLSIIFGSFVAVFFWFTYGNPNVSAQIVSINIYIALVLIDLLFVAANNIHGPSGNKLFITSLSLLIFTRVYRAGTILFGADVPSTMFVPSSTQLFYLAIPSVAIPMATISCFMLGSEKLINNLTFLNRHDYLTQCLNKKGGIEELEREVARANRHGRSVTLMLLDIDDFKKINDTHGHLIGDQVLVEFAKKVTDILRVSDQLCRFGGDEFMIILPDTDLQKSNSIAQRIHSAGRESLLVPWTLSIGISEFYGHGDTQNALFTRADQALYSCKSSGKDKTEFAYT